MCVMLMILAIVLRKNSYSLVWYGASCHHSYIHIIVYVLCTLFGSGISFSS